MLNYPFSAPEPGAATLVAPGVFWIRMPLPFKLDHINLWLLEDNDGWTIVDTGISNQATRDLWQHQLTTTMAGRPVRRVLVTHFHPDHIGNAGWLCEQTGAPLWITTGEYLSAHAARADIAGFTRSQTESLFRQHGLDIAPADLSPGAAPPPNRYRQGVASLPECYQRIMDGDIVKIGPHDWHIATTFGHAPEHATLYCPALKLLIAGDQILPRITPNISVWGSQPESDPLKLFLASTHRLDQLPDDTLVLPSHDRVFTGLHARQQQLHQHHEKHCADLLAVLDTPKTAAEILPVLFQRKLDAFQMNFAMGEAIAHLNYLWHAGALARQCDAEGQYRFVKTAYQSA